MRTLFKVLVFLYFLSTVSSVAAAERPFVATTDPDGVQRVEVVAGSYFFKPSRMVVRANVPVELSVRKEPSVVPHNMVMEEAAAGMEFSIKLKTEPKTISFTPQKTGEFPFYCDRRFLFFKSHRARGMEGVLEVVE